MTSWIRQIHRWASNQFCRCWTDDQLRQSAVVIAPHPDDETLGCGGTILRKRQLGADVTLVYVTDGGFSHHRLMAPRDMARRRIREAHAVASAAGIPARNVEFLHISREELNTFASAARHRLQAVLAKAAPRQVLIPYSHDAHDEHRLVNALTRHVLPTLGRPLWIYEYPVWFWNRRPWTSAGTARGRWSTLAESLTATAMALWHFRSAVDIEPVLSGKRNLLSCYGSQMARPDGCEDWPILADVAGGEFLNCFFQQREFYRPRIL